MRRYLILFACCWLSLTMHAQRISRQFRDVPLSEALRQLGRLSTDYEINFLYNELEDFRVTATVSHKTIPDAIRQLIGFYPVRMTVDDRFILVECPQKAAIRYKGTVVDEKGVPMPYANIALLSPADSTLLAGGVSNEQGLFVIPCDAPVVLARVSFVGYKTLYRHCRQGALGTVMLHPDSYTIKGVEVRGSRRIVKSQTDRLQYLVAADEFAKGLDAQELMRRVPLLQVGNEGVNIIGKSQTHFLLNGRELPEEMLQAKLKSLHAEDIERVEVITIPPSKYKAEPNAGYINIVTRRDQTLGLRGDLAGSLHFQEHTNWNAYPSLNYATHNVDVSFSASAGSTQGRNDRTQTTHFADHDKASELVRSFDWDTYSANLLAKYQPVKHLGVGFLGNLSTHRIKTMQHDVTHEWNQEIVTDMVSPRPKNYNLSAELFLDWSMDEKGRMMTLTYDYLNNYARQDEQLASTVRNMQTTGSNRYRIDAWKMDYSLPFSAVNMETGLHYTHIANHSGVSIFSDETGHWMQEAGQSNEYDYTEQTAAAYLSAWRQLGSKVSLKAGLRLEKTWLEGRQVTADAVHREHYLYLFPSVHFGWSPSDKAHVGLAYSRGISRPDFQYLNPFRYYTTPTNYFAGNPELTPGVTDNVELNFSNGRGLYAVLYESHQADAIGTVTAFSADGMQSTVVENCFSSDKAGLYVSWQRNLFPWWNIQLGGEVFYVQNIATKKAFNLQNLYTWSGKIETSADWFLNKKHTLVLNASYSHYFPSASNMVRYKSMALLYAQLRYSLLNNRLRLSLSVSDPFRQNIMRSTGRYADYTVYMTNYVHPHSVNLSATWSFGGDKVRRSYRQSRNTDASRAGSR